MATLPTLIVDIVVLDSDDQEISRTAADLAPAAAETLRRNPNRFDAWMAGDVFVSELVRSMPPDIARDAWTGQIQIPGFENAACSFIEAIGGMDRIPVFLKASLIVQDKRWKLEEAEKELAFVRKAVFSTDFAVHMMFFAPYRFEEYVSEAHAAYDSWGWDDYSRIDPPPSDFESSERRTWVGRYAAWQRANAPLYVYGTTADYWGGIDPALIRENVENEGDPDLDTLISCSVDGHHRDAREEVTGEEELVAIVKAWLPHAGTASPEDLSLEAAVAEWNSKQTLVTYFVDRNVILPSFPGVTAQDCLANAERAVEIAKDQLAEAENGFNSETCVSLSV